jgi:hypothetical protein
MTTDERIENQELELARVKRRNRCVLAVVILTVVGLQAGLFDPALPEVKTKRNVSPQVAEIAKYLDGLGAGGRITARAIWDKNMTSAIPVLGKAMEWYDIHKMKSIIDKAAVGEASKLEIREVEVYLGWDEEALSRGTTGGADFVEAFIAISPWAMLCLGGWALIHHMQKRRLV